MKEANSNEGNIVSYLLALWIKKQPIQFNSFQNGDAYLWMINFNSS